MKTSKRTYKLQKIYENSTCVKIGTKITTVGFGMKTKDPTHVKLSIKYTAIRIDKSSAFIADDSMGTLK